MLPLPIPVDPLFIGPVLINRSYVAGGAVALLLFGFLSSSSAPAWASCCAPSRTTTPHQWSVGISVERGVALSWAMSAVVATLAGALGLDPGRGPVAVAAAADGHRGGRARRADGIGGAILAGLLLGMFQGVASGYLDRLVGGGSRELVIAATLVLTILIRPHGLFGREDIQRI